MQKRTILRELATIVICIFPFITFGQLTINLPSAPSISTIPSEWRGYNHGAFSDLDLFNNQMFAKAYPTLRPGIIRWPSGNKSQNYDWREHLENDSEFNLSKVISYLDTFNVDLQIVVNFGSDFASDAGQFVKFCNSTNTTWANMRQDLLGNSDPINVKYWEIGNESNTRWAFGWSWLGYQDTIRSRSGGPIKELTHEKIDSLYYYGGAFYREGWVPAVGGLNLSTAILGDSKFYDTATIRDTITIAYPKLDVSGSNAVRVYRTANLDTAWVNNINPTPAGIQMLYDSITNPVNKLSLNEYSLTETEVILTPTNGIQANDHILIEYNSTDHDGAFAFRDSMKAADPSIEIGYVVSLRPDLYNNAGVRNSFKLSPPNFMVGHSYPSNITIPAAEKGWFSEAAYRAEIEVNNLIDYQNIWHDREEIWDLPNSVGIGLTEWNISLYDNAPQDHPHRGISSGVYVASLWGNLFEKSLQDSIDLRVNNHFALIASGNNFIHLFHKNDSLVTSVEGKATAMVMESIGEFNFPVTNVSGMPKIDIRINEQGDIVNVDAIEKWGGVNIGDNDYVNLILINRDDANDYSVILNIPGNYNADSIFVNKLYGTMINDTITYTGFQGEALATNSYPLNLPAFSVISVKLKVHIPGVNNQSTSTSNHLKDNFYLYPNPSNSKVYIQSDEDEYSLIIYDGLGRLIQSSKEYQSTIIDVSTFPKGICMFYIQTDKTKQTYKVLIE